MSYKFIELKGKILSSIGKLMDNDSFLLEINANERSITHKLAEYLQEEFEDWNVDCEYNRMINGKLNDPKRMKFPVKNVQTDDTEGKTVFPDIIIHERNRRNNLLVIEVKKIFKSKINTEFDELKLKTFTGTQFEYSFGLHIIFYVKSFYKKSPILHWFENGELMEVKNAF